MLLVPRQRPKKLVKTQGKTPDAYSGGSHVKFDDYIIKMEHQFVMNNILEPDHADSRKISYAVTL